MVNAVLSQFEEYDRRIFWGILGIGAIAIFCYIYFIGVSVYAVIARKEAELETGRVTAQVADLESKYAQLLRDVDLTLAHTLGFVEV